MSVIEVYFFILWTPVVFDAPIMSLKNSPVNKTLGQYHRLQAKAACGSEPTNSYFTSSISLGRHFLVKNDSFWLLEAQKCPTRSVLRLERQATLPPRRVP